MRRCQIAKSENVHMTGLDLMTLRSGFILKSYSFGKAGSESLKYPISALQNYKLT